MELGRLLNLSIPEIKVLEKDQNMEHKTQSLVKKTLRQEISTME